MLLVVALCSLIGTIINTVVYIIFDVYIFYITFDQFTKFFKSQNNLFHYLFVKFVFI